VDKRPISEAQELRQLAKKLRQRASEAALPGYAELLTRAAADVEQQVEKIEALDWLKKT